MNVIHYTVGQDEALIVCKILSLIKPVNPLLIVSSKEEASFFTGKLSVLGYTAKIQKKTLVKIAYDSAPEYLRKKLKSKIPLAYIKKRLSLSEWIEVRDVMSVYRAFIESGKDDFMIPVTSKSGYMNTASSFKEINTDFFDYSAYGAEVVDRQYILNVIEKAYYLWKLVISEDMMPIDYDSLIKYHNINHNNFGDHDLILATRGEDYSLPKVSVLLKQKVPVYLLCDICRGLFGSLNDDVLLSFDTNHQLLPDYTQNSLGGNIGLFLDNIRKHIMPSEPLIKGAQKDRLIVDDRKLIKPHTIICRSISGAIMDAFNNINNGRSVKLLGGVSGYGLDDLLDLFLFSENRLDEIKNKFIVYDFKTYQNYKSIAKQFNDVEMLRLCHMLETIPDVEALIKNLSSIKNQQSKVEDVLITTVNKAKGLRWPLVVLGSDFNALSLNSKTSLTKDQYKYLYAASVCSSNILCISNQLNALIR